MMMMMTTTMMMMKCARLQAVIIASGYTAKRGAIINLLFYRHYTQKQDIFAWA